MELVIHNPSNHLVKSGNITASTLATCIQRTKQYKLHKCKWKGKMWNISYPVVWTVPGTFTVTTLSLRFHSVALAFHDVSRAHFHVALSSLQSPVSFGFSSPLLSLRFINETNSLLLSVPLPSSSKTAKTTSTRWSESSSSATVRATWRLNID